MKILSVELVKQVESKGLRSGADHNNVFTAGKNINGGPDVTLAPHSLGVLVSYAINGKVVRKILPSANIACINIEGEDSRAEQPVPPSDVASAVPRTGKARGGKAKASTPTA